MGVTRKTRDMERAVNNGKETGMKDKNVEKKISRKEHYS